MPSTHKAPHACPVCASSVKVTEVACGDCGTSVRGHFDSCGFCKLTPDQITFIETFLSCRGNISVVGESLGVSYPTVIKRLDGVVLALSNHRAAVNIAVREPADDGRRAESQRSILDMLDRGLISADDATHRLKEL